MGKEAITKYAIIAAIVGLGGWFVAPILTTIALNLINLAILAFGLFGLYLLIPAIAEFLASLAWKLWEMAIRQDPITRLKRDLHAHSEEIEDTEKGIAEANAGYEKLRGMVKQNKALLSAEALQQAEDDLEELKNLITDMINVRDNEIRKHSEFERTIVQAEAQYAMGQAFKTAFGSFKLNGRGPRALGSKVALDEVQKSLSESRGRLAMVVSRSRAALPAKA